MSERESFLTFLFDRNDQKVENIKFFRGNAADLTVDELCAAALEVVRDTWETQETGLDSPPRSNAERFSVAVG